MFWIKRMYYRTFQFIFNIGARVLPWRKAEIVDGEGSINRIPELLTEQKAEEPLVVTDPGLMAAGVAPKILNVLDDADQSYTLYDEVEPNPSVTTVNRIFDLYKKEDCDSVIAVGGGSSMDAAKAACARIARPKKTVNQLGGLLKVRKKIPPFIAVPTTAGTGSETTIAALITDTETHHKYALMDLSLIPRYAVLDPDLTTGLPPHITASTGMDALTHAVEAYLCWTYNTKESIRFAEEAVMLIFKNLEKAYADGSDLDARASMLLASYKAGFAFTRAGVGNVHAIAHTLGGLYNAPHGLANAVILPVVLEDYGEAVSAKLARLAYFAGVAVRGDSDDKNARRFIDEIYAMNARMGIPTGFDFIKDEDIPQMIEWALKEANPIYPVPVVYNEARCRRIIERIRIKSYGIDENCTGCNTCAKLCPVDAISGKRGEQHKINPTRCTLCGVCGRVCPAGAVHDENGILCTRIPKSQWKKPIIDFDACTACGICTTLCTAGALSISEPTHRGDIDVFATLSNPERCIFCGLCVRECPVSAVSFQN